MGWLSPEEQMLATKRYGVHVTYLCDLCQYPILDTPVVDPRAGYFPWPVRLPPSCRPFLSREPKKTYHSKTCAAEALGNRSKEDKARQKYEVILQTMNLIVEKITNKPERQWTKEKVIVKLAPTPERVVKRAIRELRKEKKIRKRGGGYVLC